MGGSQLSIALPPTFDGAGGRRATEQWGGVGGDGTCRAEHCRRQMLRRRNQQHRKAAARPRCSGGPSTAGRPGSAEPSHAPPITQPPPSPPPPPVPPPKRRQRPTLPARTRRLSSLAQALRRSRYRDSSPWALLGGCSAAVCVGGSACALGRRGLPRVCVLGWGAGGACCVVVDQATRGRGREEEDNG